MKAPAGVTLLAILGLLAAGPAGAANRPCGQAVIADWGNNGRIDGSYPPRCYGAALRALPEDVRAYSTAVEDITRAMHARIGAEARDDGNGGNTGLGTSRGADSGGPRHMSARGQAPAEKEQDGTSDGLARTLASGVPRVTSLPLPLVLGAALMLLLGLASLISRGLR